MNAQCHACIGGTAVREDIARLSGEVHVVVGTPGRVQDMISRRALGKNLFLFFSLTELTGKFFSGFCTLNRKGNMAILIIS